MQHMCLLKCLIKIIQLKVLNFCVFVCSSFLSGLSILYGLMNKIYGWIGMK